MSDSRRKRYSINFSAPASPASPSLGAFPFAEQAPAVRPASARAHSARPSSAYGLIGGASSGGSAATAATAAGQSFYRIPNDDQRNVSLDSLADSSSIKLLLIGDATVGKTAMILSYCNELPTRSQVSLFAKDSARAPSLQARRHKRIQNLKTIEKRKRYSLNDYEELFTHPAAARDAPSLSEDPDAAGLSPDAPPREDPNEIIIDTRSTIGVDIRTNLVNIDHRYFKVTMWDTAGQERYRNAMIPSLYKGSHGILLSYDICSRKSFHNCLDYWLQEVLNCCAGDKKLRLYLVGNKIDLYKVRQVTHEDVLRLIAEAEQKHGVKIAGNFEVSCKWHQVVERTFNIIIKDLAEHGCYEDDLHRHGDSPRPTHTRASTSTRTPTPTPTQAQAQAHSCDSCGPVAIPADVPMEIERRGSTIVRRRSKEPPKTIDISKPLDPGDSSGRAACCV
ncbi:Rab family GTPase YPT11 [Lachancea thermotolerans CBS 6340]|uniref:KLTH0F18810p n=1 Tax=Lachancea thermotolerans (strain ATCC 56472 / CBS 6340 / NRRL Y-8284) TaxID=559295 RepID=C5DJS7_LACTC|nr:KLTH0F18810p [Lachancea thermotolerans CBS 6340]CAR24566.1 KLTH0F18810p [Lachancea thermotolerans CBS 6340]